MKRVVITGVGVVTPLGNDVPSFWERLVSGQSGISVIDSFDTSGLKTNIAGVVRDFQLDPAIAGKEARRMDRFAQFAAAASVQALNDAGLNLEAEDPERIGVYIGSGTGGIKTLLDNYRTLLERGPNRVSPTVVPMMIVNMAAAQVSMLFGLKGPVLAPVTACASSHNAIGEAYHLIQREGADVMVAGGTEATLTDLALAGFSNATALSARSDDPTLASRPFDAMRDGFVPAEGAGILVLESLEHAERRGARIYAEVIGYAATSDAYHIVATDPEGLGAYRAMKLALAEAGIDPSEVDHISAHATSTPPGDISETKAIKKLFGEYAYRIPINAIKSMLGHTLGASGGIAAVALVKTMQEGIIPPTINLEHPDPMCDLDYVPNRARKASVRIGVSNGFGFGGHNAVIVLKKYEASA